MARSLDNGEGDEMGPIQIRGVNLNTIVLGVGFLSTFAAVVLSWSSLQNEQRNFGDFILEQKSFNSAVVERFKAAEDKLQAVPLITNQIVGLQSADSNFDTRLGRINDSSADIRAQLSSIVTQVALVKQSVDRIEAWRSADRAAAGSTLAPN